MKKALYLYGKVANKNDALAKNNLKVIYKKGGDGIELDMKKTLYWYGKAANQKSEQHNIILE